MSYCTVETYRVNTFVELEVPFSLSEDRAQGGKLYCFGACDAGERTSESSAAAGEKTGAGAGEAGPVVVAGTE